MNFCMFPDFIQKTVQSYIQRSTPEHIQSILFIFLLPATWIANPSSTQNISRELLGDMSGHSQRGQNETLETLYQRHFKRPQTISIHKKISWVLFVNPNWGFLVWSWNMAKSCWTSTLPSWIRLKVWYFGYIKSNCSWSNAFVLIVWDVYEQVFIAALDTHNTKLAQVIVQNLVKSHIAKKEYLKVIQQQFSESSIRVRRLIALDKESQGKYKIADTVGVCFIESIVLPKFDNVWPTRMIRDIDFPW